MLVRNIYGDELFRGLVTKGIGYEELCTKLVHVPPEPRQIYVRLVNEGKLCNVDEVFNSTVELTFVRSDWEKDMESTILGFPTLGLHFKNRSSRQNSWPAEAVRSA